MIKSMPIKIVISFITIVLLVSIFYIPQSHAIGDIMGEGKGFLDASNGENSVINQEVLKTTSDSIYNTLLAMAIIIAVIVAMVLGIQFMYASADEKAKVKEALMPFIVGCIVVFGSFTIWKVFVNIGNSAESSINGITTTHESSNGGTHGGGGSHRGEASENKTLTREEWCEKMKEFVDKNYFGDMNDRMKALKENNQMEEFYFFIEKTYEEKNETPPDPKTLAENIDLLEHLYIGFEAVIHGYY